MSKQNSYSVILRSSTIIGGAQIMNILSGVFKMKAAALILGPVGVGFIGLYMNLMQAASSFAALGLGTAGTRQIAAANAEGDGIKLERARRSLFWLTLLLAIVGGVTFWLCRGLIVSYVMPEASGNRTLGWLAVGVMLTVLGGYYKAFLTGMRDVAAVAYMTIAAGSCAAVLGVLAIWLWADRGIVLMVIMLPLATLVFGYIFMKRLETPSRSWEGIGAIVRQWPEMIRLGIPFMLSGLVTVFGLLAVRTIVKNEAGPAALGQFQASWTIGMMYIGYVLTAMGTDYYPRLTAVIKDNEAAIRLVNEQTEVALLLCAPVMLLMLGLAPWVITLLYSSDFTPAIEILRWQILGDILKVISWPLGFLLLARGAGKSFITAESVGIGFFVLVTWFAVPVMGVTATGPAFLAMYIVYLPFVWWLGKRSTGFYWSRMVWLNSIALVFAAIATILVAWYSETGAIVVGGLSAIGATIYAAITFSKHLQLPGRLGRIFGKIAMIIKPH